MESKRDAKVKAKGRN